MCSLLTYQLDLASRDLGCIIEMGAGALQGYSSFTPLRSGVDIEYSTSRSFQTPSYLARIRASLCTSPVYVTVHLGSSAHSFRCFFSPHAVTRSQFLRREQATLGVTHSQLLGENSTVMSLRTSHSPATYPY